jgi:outer membrane lipoprotein-sorting protein
MSFLRTISTRRLAALCASAAALGAGGTAIALAGGDGPKPPPKPLAAAVHDGLTAPETQGVTARVKFTNHLIDSSGIQGSNPLLSGATGRLWLSPDRGLRLELQSENGDAQVVANERGFWVYDGTANTVYRGQFPKHRREGRRGEKRNRIPSVARIQRGLDRARRHQLDISGPVPGNIAGQPAYTVRVGPGRPGGLLGAVELAWDAAHGLPLRVAVYARGNSDPVLELTATEIDYGPVADSTFLIDPPADARVVDLSLGRGHRAGRGRGRHPARRLPFTLSAPDTLAGRKRSGVRVLRLKQGNAALVRYGKGLDALAVIEKRARPEQQQSGRRHGRIELPEVTIGDVTGHVLDTPLGSVVTFDRAGVSYTVLGSVPAAVAEAAARGL